MKSIMQSDTEFCYFFHKSARCQGYATETHHIFGGSNRGLSEEDGLTIRVCRNCHNGLHGGPNYMDKVRDLRRKAQKMWEDNYKGEGKARAEFMKRYGKSWL